MEDFEEHQIVIVGGGICGLAIALALHRKGIKSLVLERSDCLREQGGAIGILANGWRALDQLGLSLSTHLRKSAILLQRSKIICLEKGIIKEISFRDETRCLKRGYLINALAEALPKGTIRFDSCVVSVELDSTETSFPILRIIGGKTIIAKIVIGCDGSQSVIGKFVGLNPTRKLDVSTIRGITNYPKGHTFSNEFIRCRKKDGSADFGRIPIDDKSVHWFLTIKSSLLGVETWEDDLELIKKHSLELLSSNGFPDELKQMIQTTNSDTISLNCIRYRAPWELIFGKFRKGTVVVAGDALHAMGPFLGQGGSAGLEDAVVLGRRLSKIKTVLGVGGSDEYEMELKNRVGEAMDGYAKERRRRLVELSTQTYVIGRMNKSTSLFVKVVFVLIMAIFFRDQNGHTRFDCGRRL